RIVCIRQRRQPFLISDTASVMALARAQVSQSMWGDQSLNAAWHGQPMAMDMGMGMGMMPVAQTGMMPMHQIPMGQSMVATGNHMTPSQRTTAGSFLPGTNVPLVRSTQAGVAVELQSGPSVRELNDYWTRLLAQFTGPEGAGILEPHRNSVFFAVDEAGVGELGQGGNTARLYRLRIGPLRDINEAQTLCDRLHRFRNTPCHVVRIQ
ncbi:MAG: SPOR domain-containing protein, partial [Alphaproteobacteria bacterium]|nr:SPOR domain-containing protein [Alphaproteobacteria bacterium]